MKYFNIKRYKFSTITRSLSNSLNSILNLLKLINFKKKFNYFDDIRYLIKKTFKYFDLRRYNILSNIRKIKIKSNRFLFFHLPSSIIFFALLYLIIPTFYTYEKSAIKKVICKSEDIECLIKGKINYTFFPSPRLKIKDFTVNMNPENKKTILTAKDVTIKLSIKNLLAKDKHRIKKIKINDFKSKINLKKLKKYNSIFKNKIIFLPIIFEKGEIELYNEKNYVSTIKDASIIIKSSEDSFESALKGKFLNDNIIFNITKEIDANEPVTTIEYRMKNSNFYTKVSFLNLNKAINAGKFLIKKDKNKVTGIFDYKNNQIKILKSNIRNSFIDGKMIGDIIFLPYFDFNLELNLNSINFTKVYNYFLSLRKEEQKEIFKINSKVNGKLNFSSEKIYSKNNLVKSFESRIKFYNGNIKIEQFLINLGKLGAADILGSVSNDRGLSNFKYESNIFIDNKKKFLSKFGIYNKDKLSSNIFIQGNFDLENIRASFYEIFHEEKFNTEDINFIESEFNDLMLDEDFKNLFNFQKFKVFLKSVREE